MVRVFIVLALAVIIMLAPIFSGEYEGVDNIILTSKYGKTKCTTAKVAAGILTAILTTALVAAFNLLLALIFYGTEGLDCSILFAPSDYVEGFISFNITCGTLVIQSGICTKIDVIPYMFRGAYTDCYILYRARRYLIAFLGIFIFVGCVVIGTVFADLRIKKETARKKSNCFSLILLHRGYNLNHPHTVHDPQEVFRWSPVQIASEAHFS